MTASASRPGLDFKNDPSRTGPDCLARRDVGVLLAGPAVPGSTAIFLIDALIGPLSPAGRFSAAATGSGVSDTTTASKTARGSLPRHPTDPVITMLLHPSVRESS